MNFIYRGQAYTSSNTPTISAQTLPIGVNLTNVLIKSLSPLKPS